MLRKETLFLASISACGMSVFGSDAAQGERLAKLSTDSSDLLTF
jgi:hypothetical protein